MYTTSANKVPDGTQYDPYGVLARSAMKRARTDSATNRAEAAYDALLCRNPADFAVFGLNVAKDVQDTNTATGCGPGTPSTIAASSAPAGDATAAQALAMLGLSPGPTAATGGATGSTAGSGVVGSRIAGWGGRGRNRGTGRGSPAQTGASCDASSNGGVKVVPLNQPGSAGLYAPSAAPGKLTTNPMVGMGSYRCCADFPWGDAYANGTPTPSTSGVAAWIQQNPWLTAGIAAALLWLATGTGKGTRRG